MDMLAVARQPVEPLLFAAEELDLGEHPGVVRLVRITEHSPELFRISEAQALSHSQKQEPESSDAAQRGSDRLAHRSLVAGIVNQALSDIQLAMRQKDPRRTVIRHRNRTQIQANEDFDSAVQFVFGMEQAVATDELMRVRLAGYSSFNAYCALMGWSAPAFRRRILSMFPGLDALIDAVLGDDFQRAPVLDS